MSERLFRLFEEPILRVLEGYPDHVEVLDPKDYNLRPSTIIGRCRDAVNSLLRYNWSLSRPCPRILELPRIRRDLAVVLQRDQILFGPRAKLTGANELVPGNPVRHDLHFREDAKQIVEAFCMLHSAHIFRNPTVLDNVPAIDLRTLDHYDCTITSENAQLTIV